MPEELIHIIRVPLPELAESLRQKHGLKEPFTDAKVEGNSILLTYAIRAPGDGAKVVMPRPAGSVV